MNELDNIRNKKQKHRTQEDLKRLKQDCSGGGYNQVEFQYSGGDATSGSGNAGIQHGPSREEYSNSPTCEEAEQAFSLPRNFEVPASIQLPETMKQHAIIEKTARFIASQGVQMEILLKAKQSNNVQFEFLSQNSILNPYYKFVMNSMKNGTYPKVEETTAKESSDLASGGAATTSSSEVASLFGVGTMNALNKPVITVPTIKYKPSANCAYTQLISKIKGVPLPAVIDENATMLSLTSTNSSTSATNSPRPDTPNGSNFTPVLLQYNGNTYVTAADGDESNSNSNTNSNSNAEGQQLQVELLKNSSALALAQDYLSDSEDTEDEMPTAAAAVAKPEPVLNFPIPVDNLKNIIDKTATYVIKNGRQFEETLRTKSEERFTFLLHDNEHYPYYMYKITGDPDAASKEQKTRKAAAVAAALLSKKGLNVDKTISPVSFSIKPKDDATTTTLPPALPQENSDDDDVDRAEKKSETLQQRTVPEHVQKAIQLVEIQLMARNAQLAAVAAATGTTVPVAHVVGGAATAGGIAGSATTSGSSNNSNPATTTTPTRSRFDIDYNSAAAAAMANSKTLVKSTKAEMERNALFEQQQQNRQKELKKAEEKVKDKLAQIAREKLGGLISKEKQLQLERKRKAMAFLNQIKGTPPADNETDAFAEKKNKTLTADEVGNATDDSDASVHSIPITSYGPDEKTDDEEERKLVPAITAPLPPQFHVQPEHHNYKMKTTTTVTLSDDDDVQLVSEIKAPPRQKRTDQERYKILSSSSKSSALKRRSRSRTRESILPAHHNKHTQHKRKQQQYSSDSSSSSSSPSSAYDEYEEDTERHRHRSKSSYTTHKSSKSKKSSTSASLKKSTRHNKKKSKKHRRSRSPSSRSPSTTTTRHRSHRSKSQRRSRSRSSSHRHIAMATHRFSVERSCSIESDGDRNHQRQRHQLALHYTSSKRSSKRRSPTPTTNRDSSRRKEKKRKYEYER